MTDYQFEKQLEINANKEEVWKALTEPAIIKQYLFGTETTSDWQSGSEIHFKGSYEGTDYHDKGIIQKIEAGKILQYTYFSGFSGMEDKAENYHLITFELFPKNEHTLLQLKQENIQNEQAMEHSKQSWDMVLGKMKEIIENELA